MVHSFSGFSPCLLEDVCFLFTSQGGARILQHRLTHCQSESGCRKEGVFPPWFILCSCHIRETQAWGGGGLRLPPLHGKSGEGCACLALMHTVLPEGNGEWAIHVKSNTHTSTPTHHIYTYIHTYNTHTHSTHTNTHTVYTAHMDIPHTTTTHTHN